MGKLSTTYLGIPVNSPVIVGACDLVETPEHLTKMEKAGAGAIVYKSLFEEQIQLEDMELSNMLDSYNERNAEMTRLFQDKSYAGPEEYLSRLSQAKKRITIPLIGSLNAIYPETWIKYAKAIESTGVDGLELNFFSIPFSDTRTGAEIENEQLAIVKSVVEAVKIPVSVKLSPYYSNLINFISRLQDTGIQGIVLFNKLFQPDIDIDSIKHIAPWNLSSEKEYRLTLRYAGLLYGEFRGDIIGNRGVYHAEDVIRLLLAGSDSVQIVSTIYKNGFGKISEINQSVIAWMTKHGFKTIDDFRGKLSRINTLNPLIYKRAQYIDMMLNSGKLINRPGL
jgi:dihydroorotate dehydrogenase (fumarate)